MLNSGELCRKSSKPQSLLQKIEKNLKRPFSMQGKQLRLVVAAWEQALTIQAMPLLQMLILNSDYNSSQVLIPTN